MNKMYEVVTDLLKPPRSVIDVTSEHVVWSPVCMSAN